MYVVHTIGALGDATTTDVAPVVDAKTEGFAFGLAAGVVIGALGWWALTQGKRKKR